MSVSVEMVKSLVVKTHFSLSERSLNNGYEITLTDNRFAAGEISSEKLRSLIKFLDKEKVFFKHPCHLVTLRVKLSTGKKKNQP